MSIYFCVDGVNMYGDCCPLCNYNMLHTTKREARCGERNERRCRNRRRDRHGRCVVVVGVGGVPAAEGGGSAPDSGYEWRQLKFGACVMSVH